MFIKLTIDHLPGVGVHLGGAPVVVPGVEGAVLVPPPIVEERQLAGVVGVRSVISRVPLVLAVACLAINHHALAVNLAPDWSTRSPKFKCCYASSHLL